MAHLATILGFPVLMGLSMAVAAAEMKCPKGTTPKAEETPEVREAWCEKDLKGRTVMHGPYRAWWPNGRLGTVGQHSVGQPVGRWEGWYPDGKKQGTEWYEKGKLVRRNYLDGNGKSVEAKPNSISTRPPSVAGEKTR
jgi:hypothetical protein